MNNPKIRIPQALEAIADEANFFMYQIIDEGPDKKVGKRPANFAAPFKGCNTDEAATHTLREVVERVEAYNAAPDKIAKHNANRKEYAEAKGSRYTPILRYAVGYVPREGSAGVIIDLDDVVSPDDNTSIIDFDVMGWLDGFKGYCEVSTSGTGLRVVMPREFGDELLSDRREANGCAFQAKAEQAKGFALTLTGSGDWARDDDFVRGVCERRDAGLRERRIEKNVNPEDLGDIALDFLEYTLDDLESMLAAYPNEGIERGEWIGLCKAVREAFEPRGLGEEAFDIFDAWTATGKEHSYDPVHNRDKWDEPLDTSAKTRTTLASVLKVARENKWRSASEADTFEETAPSEPDNPYAFLKVLDTEKVGAKGNVTRAVHNYMNAVRIVRHMPDLKGLIGRNMLNGGLLRLRDWSGEPLRYAVEWTDPDMHRVLQIVQGFKKDKQSLFGHFSIEALKNAMEGGSEPVQPIKRAIESLPKWDGRPRIDDWLMRYFGVSDTPLHAAYGRKFMIGLIARGHAEIGFEVKLDTVLVLVGMQGLQKSEFFNVLAGSSAFFTDHIGEISKKEARENIAGRWIVELSEGEIVTKADRRALKGFLTAKSDKFRAAYARNVQTVPRACAFVMPTNEEGILNDPTGSRRFWPVKVTRGADLGVLRAERDLMLSEALVAYRAGEAWWLTEDEDATRETNAEEYQIEDPIEDDLAHILQHIPLGQIVSQSDLIKALELPSAANGAIAHRVRDVLGKFGWERHRVGAKRGYRRGDGDSKPAMSEKALSAMKEGTVIEIRPKSEFEDLGAEDKIE